MSAKLFLFGQYR